MLEALLGVTLTAALPRLLRRVFPEKAERHRKELLKRLLEDKRFPQGRSLKELRRKTGTPESECKTLLSEIGAEGITLRDGSEGWRLPSM